MLMGLDSVTSDGVEYYFAGKSADSNARWFVGGTEQFAEYKDGQLTIKGNIFVTGSDKNISEQLAQIDFIREAFGENAQGLILGTAIIVGYTDENETFVPMAGLSGVYDKDAENGGPAAWYGGTPDDAKSVIFMDGTGYFADGLFRWDKDKGVNLGNGAIKINYDGSVEFGGDIKIGGTGEETLDSLLTAVATLFDYWSLDENGNLVTDKQVLIKNNLIVEQDTSSGGEGEDTPSGGISGVKVNGVTYYDDNGDGVIDLGTISGGGGTADLSNYYTKAESDNRYLASSLLGSNTLIHSGNIGSQSVASAKSLVASDGTTYVSYNATYGQVFVKGITIGYGGNTIETASGGVLNIQANSIGGTIISQYGGNVLIGTAVDSGYKFDVYGTGRFKSPSASDNYTALRLTNAWYGGNGKKYTDIAFESAVGYRGGVIRCGIDGTYGSFDSMSFGEADNGASSYIPYLTISSVGNVGIGTTSPAEKLDVNGNIQVGASMFLYSGTSNPYIRFKLNGNMWYCQVYTTNGKDGIFLGSTSSKSLKVDASGNVYCPQNLIVAGDVASA